MKPLLERPLVLLLATGTALGFNLPLGKLAAQAGINPFLWAALIALVPGLVLSIVALRSGSSVALRRLLPFAVISGLAAYVVPNAIIFLAIPHIGSGLAGLMYALSPVVTAALSLASGVRPPSRGLLLSVALGLAGAVLVIAGRQSLAVPTAANWLLIALVVPLSLAIGNVYRTAYWPPGATPAQLAASSNLLAAPMLLAAAAWSSGGSGAGALLAPLAAQPWLVLAQCTASTVMFALFFRLQWVGGPTYLSQIGYVAAAVALAVGVAVLGESYPWPVWLGAGLILAGIASTLRSHAGPQTR